MALSKSQFKEVLDKVFNNGNPDTTYVNNAGSSAITMYLNEMIKHADILRRVDGVYEYIIAIIQKENHTYLDEESQIQYFTCKDIKDGILVNVDNLEEYNRGVSSYIGMKTYIRNICAFLGIKMVENFDSLQPAYYDDMANIVRKYCSLTNKGLAYWGRYDVSGEPTYRSYIPLMCLVDIAIYLSNLGIFSEDYKWIFNPPLFTTYFTNSMSYEDIILYPKATDLYNFVKPDKFIEWGRTYDSYNTNTYYEQFMSLLYGQYGGDFSDNNAFLLDISGNAGDLYEFDEDCRINSMNGYRSYIYVTCEHNFNVIRYSYNGTAFTKTITNYEKEQIHVISVIKSSFVVNNNIAIKTYGGYTSYNSGGLDYYNKKLIAFPSLSFNHTYTIGVDLKIGNQLCLLAGSGYNLYLCLAKENKILGEKDLVVYLYTYSTSYYLIIKNIQTFSSNANYPGLFSNYLVATRSGSTSNWNYVDYISSFCSGSDGDKYPSTTVREMTFDSPKEFDIYSISSGIVTYLETRNMSSNTLTLPTDLSDLGVGSCLPYLSLGELVDYNPPQDMDGLSVISGAVTPQNVIDLNSFITTYNQAIYRTISNPYYEEEVLDITTMHTDTWVACNTTTNIPVDQNTAQNPNVDDLTDKEMEEVGKGIDSSTNDDDSEEPTDENPTPEEGDKGNLDTPEYANTLNLASNSFIRQWVLTKENLDVFGNAINHRDFITTIVDLIGDPLDAVISLQVFPTTLVPTIDPNPKHVVIRGRTVRYKNPDDTSQWIIAQGLTLTTNRVKFDLGEIDLTASIENGDYLNYNDLENTRLILYLPFIGNIDLDIRDFYGGKIAIDGYAESYTGQIIYYIKKIRNEVTQVISTLTGQFSINIPIKQDGFASFMNSFTRG